MKHLKRFNENFDDSFYGYHVTSRKNLESIMETGLEPRVPEDYGVDGDIKGVYLFKTIDDCQNALFNWLGERIEEWEEENDEEYDEVVLKVKLDGLDLLDSVEFEWTCLEQIDPERIIEIIEM
jgi:hypothetical protein